MNGFNFAEIAKVILLAAILVALIAVWGGIADTDQNQRQNRAIFLQHMKTVEQELMDLKPSLSPSPK